MTATPAASSAEPGSSPVVTEAVTDVIPAAPSAEAATPDSAAGSGDPVAPRDRFRHPALSDSLSPAERVIPSWTDPTVRRASELVGGPLGRHASVGRTRILTPLRVCIAMAILVLIGGWLYKASCIQQVTDANGNSVLDQSGERPWITGCYNDVVPLYASHGLDKQKTPYTTAYNADGTLVPYSEYPVVTGYWAWGVSEISKYYRDFTIKVQNAHLPLATVWARLLPVPLDVAAYFTINAILLGFVYLFAVSCTARMARRRVWDTAIMCLSPLLIVHAFTNWDLLPIGLTAGAMLAWSKGRWRPDRPWAVGWPALSGVLIGLGTSAKLYPVLLLLPLLVLSVRAGRGQAFAGALVGAVVTWLVINLPVIALYPTGWWQFVKMNSERPAEWDSWYQIYMSLSGRGTFSVPAGQTPHLLNDLSLLLFVLVLAAIGWFALSTARRPRFAQLAFLVVAAFLMTNKVWSPQYSLWLVPLVALALPRWRPVLAWQFAEAATWILLMFTFDQDTAKALPIYPFDGMALIRDVLLLSLVVRVVREAMRPGRDLVRAAGDDDPTGGVLADAPDRFTLPSLPALLRRTREQRRTVPATPAAEEAADLAGV